MQNLFNGSSKIKSKSYIYIYIYIYVCVCVCCIYAYCVNLLMVCYWSAVFIGTWLGFRIGFMTIFLWYMEKNAFHFFQMLCAFLATLIWLDGDFSQHPCFAHDMSKQVSNPFYLRENHGHMRFNVRII